MALTDEELLEKLKELKEKNIQMVQNGEPIELSSLRKFLIDGIKDQNVVTGFKLKMLFGIAFGIPQETLEMQQLHELQLAYDKKFSEIKTIYDEEIHDLKDEIAENKRDAKFTRYGLIAVAATFIGIPYLPELFRIIGFP